MMNIRDLGFKTTKARESLIDIFNNSSRPLGVSEAFSLLKKRGISVDQATIYRAVDAFSEKGIVREVYFNDGVVRYELSDKPEHHHVICVSCGQIEDIMDCSVERIENQIKKKKGFSIISHSLEFFGVCLKCRKNKS